MLIKGNRGSFNRKKSGRSNTIAGRSFVLKIKLKRDKLHLEEIIFSTSSRKEGLKTKKVILNYLKGNIKK